MPKITSSQALLDVFSSLGAFKHAPEKFALNMDAIEAALVGNLRSNPWTVKPGVHFLVDIKDGKAFNLGAVMVGQPSLHWLEENECSDFAADSLFACIATYRNGRAQTGTLGILMPNNPTADRIGCRIVTLPNGEDRDTVSLVQVLNSLGYVLHHSVPIDQFVTQVKEGA